MSEIRTWERQHAEPGTVANNLALWRALSRRTRRELDKADQRGIGCGCPGCCPQPDGIRSRLDQVLRALSPPSRQQLRAILTDLDDRMEHHLLPDPGPPPHLIKWSEKG